MRRRILDLFKSKFKGQKAVKSEPKTTPTEKKNVKDYRSGMKGRGRWIKTHNEFQAEKSNKVQKRRKANKVARRQRKINRAA